MPRTSCLSPRRLSPTSQRLRRTLYRAIAPFIVAASIGLTPTLNDQASPFTPTIAYAAEGEQIIVEGDIILDVPFRTQLDGTVWGASNCGPTAIAMTLEAFGDRAPIQTLRDRANQLFGIASPNTGTRIQDLAKVVSERGFTTWGLGTGKNPGKWTLDAVRREIRLGHPVVPQVYYSYLPNHVNNPVDTDHYIVIFGVIGDDFIFHDSADRYESGVARRMTAEELGKAWGSSNVPFGAFSVAPGSDNKRLITPTPTVAPTFAPTVTPTSSPTAALISTKSSAPTLTPAPTLPPTATLGPLPTETAAAPMTTVVPSPGLSSRDSARSEPELRARDTAVSSASANSGNTGGASTDLLISPKSEKSSEQNNVGLIGWIGQAVSGIVRLVGLAE